MNKSLTGIALSLLLASTAYAADSASVRKEIDKKYAVQAAAMHDKDSTAYVSILTDDYRQFRAIGSSIDLATIKDAARVKMSKGAEETAPHVENIQVTGDRAIVVSKRVFMFPYRNAKFETEMKSHTAFYNELWVRVSKSWKMKIRREVIDASAPPADFGK